LNIYDLPKSDRPATMAQNLDGWGKSTGSAANAGPAYQKVEAEIVERIKEIPKVHVETVQKIVEITQPQVVERLVQVPQVQEIETEIPGPVEVRKITREVPKLEVRKVERVVEVPQIQYTDRYVDVPQVHEIVRRIPRVEVREIPIERIIAVPKKIVQEIEKPVYRPAPHLVKKPVERTIPIPDPQEIHTRETVRQCQQRWQQPVSSPHFQEHPVGVTYMADAPQQVSDDEYEVRGTYKLKYKHGHLISATCMPPDETLMHTQVGMPHLTPMPQTLSPPVTAHLMAMQQAALRAAAVQCAVGGQCPTPPVGGQCPTPPACGQWPTPPTEAWNVAEGPGPSHQQVYDCQFSSQQPINWPSFAM